MNLKIIKKLIIKSEEIQWRFSRSSGPGGQNVNKTESKVEIIFNIQRSKSLNSVQKNLLLKKLKNKIINNCIYITVQEKRTQLQNRELAKQKLISLIYDIIMKEEKARKVTMPTKSSQRRRLESKKKRGELKRKRQNQFAKNI
tara:strand:+ start:122 stop:550 length:429 start_codon:yes stop_codon:yes gene_type:complete